MKVDLISHTPDALALLLFTKQTRLSMSPDGLAEVQAWSDEKMMKELEYMRNTIKSSWEFVDYVFAINGVSRAFTHQLVRHRVGTSFAQQAQRAVDMSEFDYITGPSILDDMEMHAAYTDAMALIDQEYQRLLRMGANKQDARGVLPTNISTNIIFKANLRTLHEMGLMRLCVKAQGEFQEVFRAIRERVVEVHPWASKFIRVWCAFHGTCVFPTFPTDECHVKPIVYDPEEQRAYGGGISGATLNQIHFTWLDGWSEAQPEVIITDNPSRGD